MPQHDPIRSRFTPRLSVIPMMTPLLTSLLLASCAQQPASPALTTQQPSTSHQTSAAGHIYELQFQRDGQGKLVSSAIRAMPQPSIQKIGTQKISTQKPSTQELGTRKLNNQNISAQATRLLDDQLDFNYVSSGTLNKDGQWYVRVTYRVTNHSSQPISDLGFVPLDTDAAAGATPSVTPTVGATTFKDIRHYDGSDASDRAADLVAGQAVDVGGVTDPAATPYVPISTSGLNVSLPSGLVLGSGGISGSGWQTSGTLAPGASTDVTFATRMPAVSGTADPFFYTVVLTSVGYVDVPVSVAPQAGANPNVNLPDSGPAYVNGTIGDPTDPASTQGLKFTVAASDADAAGLTVTASSSNTAIALTALSSSGANRTLTITPKGVGYADITLTVADGTRSASYLIHYAASQAAGATTSTRLYSGASNASSAQDVGGGYMLVADDEFNTLKLYPSTSSTAVKKFDFTSSLNLTDMANPEMDLEASARLGNRIFWLASESNSKSGKVRTNRNRIFATDLSGSGASTSLNFVGYYGKLKDDLLAWDKAKGNALGLNTSAATGVIPETDGGVGYNIEGLAFKPGSTTAYIGFRAPLETTSSRNLALIVPVTNLPDLVTGAASTAAFGMPIQLDLGGRAIRELKCNDQGCLILAGPASSGSNFALYSWSGNAGDAPHLRSDLQSLATSMDGSFESIVTMPDVNPDSDALSGQPITLLTDNGDSVYYGDGTGAKDLNPDWQKFRAETVKAGGLPATSCTVSGLSVTPAAPSLTVGGSQLFKASYTTSPANCTASVSWKSSDTSKLTLDASGLATAVAAGSVSVSATVTPGPGTPGTGTPSTGTPVSASTDVNITAPVTPPANSLPDVSVYRVGDGSAALSSAATAVFVDTYSGNDGALVSTVALPTTTAGGNKPLVASGSASSEGLLSRSANGQYLVLTGYSAPLGTAKIASSNVARVAGRIDAAGTINTTTTFTDAYTGDNIRSAASDDGRSFYVSGGVSGVRLYALGASSGTSIRTSATNLRQLNIFGGQLYVSSGSGNGTKGVMAIGSGLPATSGQTMTRLPGLSDTLTADSYGYFMADLDGTPGPDTLYIADGTSGLQKFTLQDGNWAASGVVSGKFAGLSGVQQGNSVTLFATSSAGNQLLKLTDSSGFSGSLGGTPTVLVTAKTNTALRGVALAPSN